VRRVSPFSFLCLAFAAATRLQAQQAQEPALPESLRDQALSVYFQAFTSEGEGREGWESEARRNTVTGTPVGFKLVGSNVVILVQVTPFLSGPSSLTLVAQSQIWYKGADGSLSYRTSLDSVTLRLAERVFFYPLGRSDTGKTPLRLEIFVDKYREPADKDALGKDQAGKDPAGKEPEGKTPVRDAGTEPPAPSNTLAPPEGKTKR
jgi:hypothetical protein